jgi:hypothetical protein
LRSGFATEAAARGAPERGIMRQTGHRSLEMVRHYIREGDRYRGNASGYLGLQREDFEMVNSASTRVT